MRIAGPNGNRSVPAGSFFVLPSTDVTKETVLQSGEILTEVVLPPWPAATRSTYLKRRIRGSWDFALAGVALTAELEAGCFRNPRIVLSGVAPIPWRTKEAEAVLDGQQINTSVAARVADAALIGAEPLSKNAYKMRMVHTAVQDALMSL
jgi:xanthine dehydrogenase YagS FAD-binding subunit